MKSATPTLITVLTVGLLTAGAVPGGSVATIQPVEPPPSEAVEPAPAGKVGDCRSKPDRVGNINIQVDLDGLEDLGEIGLELGAMGMELGMELGAVGMEHGIEIGAEVSAAVAEAMADVDWKAIGTEVEESIARSMESLEQWDSNWKSEWQFDEGAFEQRIEESLRALEEIDWHVDWDEDEFERKLEASLERMERSLEELDRRLSERYDDENP